MKQKIFEILDSLDINYTNYEHVPVHSCIEAKWVEIPWKRVKSILIRNKKWTNFYMVVLWDDKPRLDTNLIRAIFDDSKMSFVEEETMVEKIWLRPWSVSPFALINNTEKDIKVVFDSVLKDMLIWFHPLQNDNTVVLNMADIERFLEYMGFEYFYWEL
jgi:Ala-tRNA(Pro) deacylase